MVVAVGLLVGRRAHIDNLAVDVEDYYHVVSVGGFLPTIVTSCPSVRQTSKA